MTADSNVEENNMKIKNIVLSKNPFDELFGRHSVFDDIEDMISEPEFWVFLAIIFVAIWVILAIVAVAAKKSREASDNAQPVRSAKAKIIEKQQLPPNAIVFPSTLIWFLFETEDGQRVRLNAKAQCGLVVGDTGYLTWQGSRVRNFELDINKKDGV